MPDRLTCSSFAKINLYLDVLEKRPDGYHNIETIFQTVGLSDTLELEARDEDISLECNVPEVPCGPENLVYRAAELLQERTNSAHGVHMRLEKRIPVAAGLAGGSGNGAAALLGLNALWELAVPRETLHEPALQLGSDVPYCLEGGTMAATGRGERLSPLSALPTTWFVLVHPKIAVSTRAVYTSPDLARSEEKPIDGRTSSFSRAIEALEAGDIAEAAFNRMERPVFALYPELADIKRRLLLAGCVTSLMSGSGPTVFGVCSSEEAAREAAARMPDFATSVAPSVETGVVISPQ